MCPDLFYFSTLNIITDPVGDRILQTLKEMGRSKELAQRLDEVLLNGKWIANTNYREQIEKVSWQQATRKIGNLNTIALLTFHITYYLKGIIDVFQGRPLEIRDKFSFDMSPIESSGEWDILKQDFMTNAEIFVSEVSKLSDSQLEAPFVEEKYGTYLRNIDGIIEHAYYHLGQVVLLRKLLSDRN